MACKRRLLKQNVPWKRKCPTLSGFSLSSLSLLLYLTLIVLKFAIFFTQATLSLLFALFLYLGRGAESHQYTLHSFLALLLCIAFFPCELQSYSSLTCLSCVSVTDSLQHKHTHIQYSGPTPPCLLLLHLLPTNFHQHGLLGSMVTEKWVLVLQHSWKAATTKENRNSCTRWDPTR